MKIKNALAALPLALNACGGSEESSPDYTPNEPGFGIWEGAISSSLINSTTSSSGGVATIEPTSATGVGLYTSDNRAFFFKDDSQTLFTRGSAIVSGGVLYSTPYTFVNGVETGRVNFTSGDVYTSTSIKGLYSPLSLGSISGNFVMLFDDKYFRGADLNRLAGTWSYTHSNGNWNLIIQADGSFTGTSTRVASCTLSGAFSTIDTSKNEYVISATLDSNCSPYNGSYQGLAATIDTNTENDTLLMAIYNSSHGFFMKPTK